MVYAVGNLIVAGDRAATSPGNVNYGLVNEFKRVVIDAANGGIVWGSNNPPTYAGTQLIPTSAFGGSSATSPPIPYTTAMDSDINTIKGSTDIIYGGVVYDTLRAAVTPYTVLRLARAQYFVNGGGGNTGSRPSPGFLYNQAQKSWMNSTYLQAAIPSTQSITPGVLISIAGFGTQLNNMLAAYNTRRDTEAGPFRTNVCHASCHASCHGSRGRR